MAVTKRKLGFTERSYRTELASAGFNVVEFEKAGEWANILVKRRY